MMIKERRNKVYESIIWAKNQVLDMLMEDNDFCNLLSNPDRVADVVRKMYLMSKETIRYNDRLAFLAVLQSGNMSYDGFGLPSTRCAMEQFHILEKRMSKKQPVYLYFDLENQGRDDDIIKLRVL